MRIRKSRFRIIFVGLLLAEAVACAIFVASRPAIGADGWQFLERQRPKTNDDGSTEFTIVADGLNFAVFRRALGGWETAYGRFFQMVNLVPCLASLTAFRILQAAPVASSKVNSDITTLVFCGVALIQFALLAALFGIQRRQPQVAAV